MQHTQGQGVLVRVCQSESRTSNVTDDVKEGEALFITSKTLLQAIILVHCIGAQNFFAKDGPKEVMAYAQNHLSEIMQRQSHVHCVYDVTCRDILSNMGTNRERRRGNVIGDISTSENAKKLDDEARIHEKAAQDVKTGKSKQGRKDVALSTEPGKGSARWIEVEGMPANRSSSLRMWSISGNEVGTHLDHAQAVLLLLSLKRTLSSSSYELCRL